MTMCRRQIFFCNRAVISSLHRFPNTKTLIIVNSKNSIYFQYCWHFCIKYCWLKKIYNAPYCQKYILFMKGHENNKDDRPLNLTTERKCEPIKHG